MPTSTCRSLSITHSAERSVPFSMLVKVKTAKRGRRAGREDAMSAPPRRSNPPGRSSTRLPLCVVSYQISRMFFNLVGDANDTF